MFQALARLASGHGVVITLIEKGDVFAPEPRGCASVLVLGGHIAKIGDVDRRALDALGLEYDVVDATGCAVCPGFIDPHEHIIGGSGERGFASATPEIHLEELVRHGITTVVGCLGVDISGKNMPSLISKAKALREQGIDAHAWTGGYRVPPATLTSDARNDILFIEEILGIGEVAIADKRSMDPEPRELASLVHDAYIGGILAGKSQLTHFHVGDGPQRLAPLRALIDEYNVDARWLYPSHVERSEALMREAIELARAGAFVDIDVVEEDLPKWLGFYVDSGGDLRQLTISSDASIASPRTLYEQLRRVVTSHGFPLEQVLPLVTSNTARALGLPQVGQLEVGKQASINVLRMGTLEVVAVHARGGWMVRDGELRTRSEWRRESKRDLPRELGDGSVARSATAR